MEKTLQSVGVAPDYFPVTRLVRVLVRVGALSLVAAVVLSVTVSLLTISRLGSEKSEAIARNDDLVRLASEADARTATSLHREQQAIERAQESEGAVFVEKQARAQAEARLSEEQTRHLRAQSLLASQLEQLRADNLELARQQDESKHALDEANRLSGILEGIYQSWWTEVSKPSLLGQARHHNPFRVFADEASRRLLQDSLPKEAYLRQLAWPGRWEDQYAVINAFVLLNRTDERRELLSELTSKGKAPAEIASIAQVDYDYSAEGIAESEAQDRLRVLDAKLEEIHPENREAYELAQRARDLLTVVSQSIAERASRRQRVP